MGRDVKTFQAMGGGAVFHDLRPTILKEKSLERKGGRKGMVVSKPPFLTNTTNLCMHRLNLVFRKIAFQAN